MRKLVTHKIWASHLKQFESAECFKNDLQNVTVKLYHEVGHIPMEEIPEESARDVLFFLKK